MIALTFPEDVSLFSAGDFPTPIKILKLASGEVGEYYVLMRYIYVLKCGERHYKVGVATHVTKRVRYLQTSNPNKIQVVMTRLVENELNFERNLHEFLKEKRIDGGTEWFELEPQEVINLLLMINEEPEVLAVYDIVEMNKLLKLQLENRRDMNQKLDRMVGYVKRQSEITIARKALKLNEPATKKADLSFDELIEQATKICVEHGKGSTSLLQRKLSIGYAKAARLMDEMEKRGIVGPADGAYPREVFVLN